MLYPCKYLVPINVTIENTDTVGTRWSLPLVWLYRSKMRGLSLVVCSEHLTLQPGYNNVCVTILTNALCEWKQVTVWGTGKSLACVVCSKNHIDDMKSSEVHLSTCMHMKNPPNGLRLAEGILVQDAYLLVNGNVSDLTISCFASKHLLNNNSSV